jgi:hypothetical protein
MLGAVEVEGEESGEEIVVGHVGVPAVGGEDGGVEFFVGQVEPGGSFVVEVGEGAFFEFFRTLFVFGDDAGVADGGDKTLTPTLSRREREIWFPSPFGRGARGEGFNVAVPGAVDGAGEFEEFGACPLGRIEPVVAERVEPLGPKNQTVSPALRI